MPKNLLLADDSATIRKVVQIAFAHEDVAVSAASSADDALAKARAQKPDVVVIDTFMPGKSGYDLAQALRADAALGNVAILLLASPNEPFNEARAQQLRVDAWIPKPFQTTALIDQVKKLLSTPRPAASAAPPPRPAAIIPPPPPAAPKPPPAAPKPPTAAPPPRPAAPVPPPRPAAPVPPPAAAKASPTAPPAPRPAMPPATGAATVSNRPAVTAVPAPAAPRPPTAPPPLAAKPPAPVAPPPVAAKPGPSPAQLQVTAQNHAALLREAIGTASREMIEKVVWEVVPELAEIMIRERLAKLAKERDGLG